MEYLFVRRGSTFTLAHKNISGVLIWQIKEGGIMVKKKKKKKKDKKKNKKKKKK